jgi:hypothetical protein
MSAAGQGPRARATVSNDVGDGVDEAGPARPWRSGEIVLAPDLRLDLGDQRLAVGLEARDQRGIDAGTVLRTQTIISSSMGTRLSARGVGR